MQAGNDFSQCVTPDKLEVGKTYELIVTNLSGFYRYRMSDAVQVAMEATAEEMGFALADFSVYPNTDVVPNRYDFLIEPLKEITEFDMKALCECVFKNLCAANPVYYDCYADNWLAKPEVYFLQPETSLLLP